MCAEARDGEEAVALALSEKPDLALLDVKMPKLDGIDAARRILAEHPIPIVMVTAYGEQELVSRAVEAGVFGYLVKPFKEGDLLPAIATARARHEELTALRAEAESLAEALAARKAIERAMASSRALALTTCGLFCALAACDRSRGHAPPRGQLRGRRFCLVCTRPRLPPPLHILLCNRALPGPRRGNRARANHWPAPAR